MKAKLNTLHRALQNELQTELHAYFETVFAYELSKQAEDFQSMHKVSRAILEIISKNREELVRILESSKHVQTELFSPSMHGRLTLPSEIQVTGETVLNLLVDVLSKENSDLSQTLQIHAFFIHRLYDLCPNKNITDKEHWVKQIFHNKLFSERLRQKKDAPSTNTNPGTITNSALARFAKKPALTHGSPKDQFILNENSTFIQNAKKRNYPVASDVSGHTGTLLLGALIYGGLTKTELQEYLVATFSFLTMARAHTFHEVMVVGETVGLPFSYDDYTTSIPENVRHFSSYRNTSAFFPQHLHDANINRLESCETTKQTSKIK